MINRDNKFAYLMMLVTASLSPALKASQEEYYRIQYAAADQSEAMALKTKFAMLNVKTLNENGSWLVSFPMERKYLIKNEGDDIPKEKMEKNIRTYMKRAGLFYNVTIDPIQFQSNKFQGETIGQYNPVGTASLIPIYSVKVTLTDSSLTDRSYNFKITALAILAVLIVEAGIVYFISTQQKEKSTETAHSPLPSQAHVETSHKSETKRRTVISKNSESPTQNKNRMSHTLA